jgi:tetratricopeptide (TPR) repeat protein
MGVARESTHDVAGIEAQARDIDFLIGYAATLPNTDMSRIAVAGFSWGGLSNLFAASHDDRIRALVALDGSMRYFPGLVKQANVHPDQMTIPLLYIKGEDSIEEQAALEDRFKSSGPSVLNAWTHGDLISIQMLGLIHPEFSSMAQRNERLWQYEYANLQPADYDRADGVIGYAWVARYTLQFLNAYLKSDPEALSYLHKTAAENGVPKHTLAVNFRTAKAIPPSFESFRKQVGDRGFDHIADLYATTLKQQPSFTLDADTVTNWAYDLLAEGHTHEAVAAMQFSLQINPSTSAYISLGEMLARDGQQQEALKNYQKAVANDPGNPIAKAFLREYEAAR